MKRLPSCLAGLVLVVIFSGCVAGDAPREDDPEHGKALIVAVREERTPERFIEWDPSAPQAEPALRLLSEVLSAAGDDEANLAITQEEASVIMHYLRTKWQEKYPDTYPSPAVIQYEEGYYAVGVAV